MPYKTQKALLRRYTTKPLARPQRTYPKGRGWNTGEYVAAFCAANNLIHCQFVHP